MTTKHWYRSTSAAYVCNDHPRQPSGMAAELSAFTGISEGNARHIIDKLRHLHRCLAEPETMTLYRLQDGKHQKRQPKTLYDGF